VKEIEVAVKGILSALNKSKKPQAVILAGHNGSGKSTMWYQHLADLFRIPLVNADRMMLSILPESFSGDGTKRPLPPWAVAIRDTNSSWMHVAQKGVEAFVAQAMAHQVPFAMETVFSYWEELPDGTVKSKIDLISQLQARGYFVWLFFVGLSNENLSILRVQTRVENGGHAVEQKKLLSRFPKTQKAIREAMRVADATILTDNSRTQQDAFTVCRIQLRSGQLFDCRDGERPVPAAILDWLSVVCP
jgi:predicted ABC-type ATPase